MTAFSERFIQIERKLYGKARELITFGTDDLADDSVTTAKIGAAQVTASELAGASVSTAKIQDGSVTHAKLDSTAWTAVTYENSWVDYGGSDPPVMYRKVGDMVQVRGIAKNGTLGLTAFTLPVGFRPPVNRLGFAILANGAYGALNAWSDGTVKTVVGDVTSFWFNFEFSVTA